MSKSLQESQSIPHQTADLHAELLAELKRLHPPLFDGEGKLDARELQTLVAGYGVPEVEKFEFRWAGKQASKRIAFTPSKARLQPDEKRSVDFATTDNCIIEGDNLEVLKLLRKSYYGQVKCIYIDPPYNTGHDFVYSDNYREDKQAYWEQNGIVHDGVHMDTNTESAGRYHSNWLNMMQSRLLLARQLLRDDGVIFVSIDDHEVHNLRKLMDEVFGEENFVSQLVWVKKKKGSHLSTTIRSMTEYVLLYTKTDNGIELFGEEAYQNKWQPLAKRTNAHKVLRFPPRSVGTTLPDGHHAKGVHQQGSSALDFQQDFSVSDGLITTELLVSGPFVWNQSMLDSELVAGTKAALSKQFGLNVLRYDQDEKVKRPSSLINGTAGVGTNEDAYGELKDLLSVEGLLDYPKPVSLIHYLVRSATRWAPDAFVVDCFAGSGTTAQAVMELNKEDGGNRKFILVQLPEETDEQSEARKAGYKTISQITIERVKRAGAKVKAEKPEVDTGFRVFALTKSFFPENNYISDPGKTEEENVQAFREYVARTEHQYSFPFDADQLLYEIALKDGFALTLTAERLSEFSDNTVFRVTDGTKTALMCLDHELKQSTVDRLIADHKSDRLILLHRALDDTKKWNLNHTLGSNLWVT